MKANNSTGNGKTIIWSKCLNESSLLVVSKQDTEMYPRVSLRYEKYNQVHEKNLAVLTPDASVQYNEEIVAIFKGKSKVLRRPKLESVYDLISHQFVSPSNMRLHYDETTKDGYKVKTLTANKQ